MGGRQVFDNLQRFVSGSYAPHGYCLLWQPELVWTHVVSDTLIALAYFSIPLALIRFVRQRQDVAFGWMIWLFALFILACGTTHAMGVWNLWHGDYGVEAIVKAITAAASVPTAILLWRLIPQALAIPSPSQLQGVNEQLRASIVERDDALRQVKAEIAQRERAEAALVQAQKMDAIGQLTGGIAHDFNNLLQAVGGNLDLIRAQPANPEKVARWAENASKGINRGTKLTSQLLAFSRTQRLELQPVELNALIGEMEDLIKSSIGSLTSCETVLEEGLCRVLGDRTQLELAVLNLAINARDAMPKGGYLSISTREVTIDDTDPDLAPGIYAELAVVDTGTGMPPEILARALDPFFTTKGVGAGTGLGLSMAFGVAKQSGGTLRIASTVGAGTTVTLLLPCAQPSALQACDRKSSNQTMPTDLLSGMRVAVVDDDPDVRAFVVDCLSAFGAACAVFDSGDAFLAAFEPKQIDAIFLDFAMPGISGAKVASSIRQIDATMPVFIMTGYANSDALDQILQDVEIIRKPFTVDALIALARSVHISR
ncbi:MAG: response regulator [Sphingomonas sp.]|nr:response regulator [Sphingomonas sp.]